MRERIIWLATWLGSAMLCLSVGSVAMGQTASVVNRALPKFEPPLSGLAFSANPTTQEIFRAHVFEEPLVTVGGEPTSAENSALASALTSYAERASPDDFTSLTGFLESHPQSPWRAALLTDLGLEYYNTAHYSLALEAWAEACPLAADVRDAKGKAVTDRAVAELAYMYARLGRMTELGALLKSVEGRAFTGPATEKISGTRQALWTMQHRPEVAFRCGPLALLRIKLSIDPNNTGADEIFKSASTQQGFSLPRVAELSKKVGLNYQMAFREQGGEFVVPSVVHWKVGHYAALTRQAGDRYLLQDPTFRNDVWATKQALEAETSGYFLIPPGTLPPGWRSVDASEGGSVWGKGLTTGNDPGPITQNDLWTPPNSCHGMMVSAVHLMDVNLTLMDQPVGYMPPVGPTVRFAVRYNSRDAFQPANFQYGNLGSKWTCNWTAYITDNPKSLLADVNYYVQGGGDRTFTGFDTNTQSFNYQQYDETYLKRTGSSSYQMTWPDGSQLIFNQSDGSVGTTRNIFLTQIIDPQGNAVTLTYDSGFRVVAVTDAIGQVTTLTYGKGDMKILSGTNVYDVPADPYKLTKVTDPFGRFAALAYAPLVVGYQITQTATNPVYTWGLDGITDVIGLTSRVNYALVTNEITGPFIYVSDFVDSLTTPYGTTTFTNGGTGTTRFLETTYPDGSRDRVEYNQTITALPMSDPQAIVPINMATVNGHLEYRNTYYWSRNAAASSYGDYTKAKVYHWLHAGDGVSTSGILESTKEALENRIWRDYAGQVTRDGPIVVGINNMPTHIGRVLDDGSSQVYTYAYNPFGNLTNTVDPIGRTFSNIYDTNGIDLLEVRQIRAGNNELLRRMTYNSQHRPLTVTDAAGRTTTLTYNAHGQPLTATDPKNETVTCTYDTNGYLIAMAGPLPGPNDVVTATHDAVGRVRTRTDVSGYTMTFDYDNLDRMTRISFPDGTFAQFAYDRLDCVARQDRAGRQTLFEYDNLRQLTKRTDPLGRVTLFGWCRCGALNSITDPMGRTTSWLTDVQDRRIGKQYGDGSQVQFLYENTTSRLRQVIDERQQNTYCAYNLDNTLKSLSYGNATVPTPEVSFAYDPSYSRVDSMTDGIGTTTYNYIPITAFPTLGAGELASVDGPLTNDTATFAYDELGRIVQETVDGDVSIRTFDAAGRVIGQSNALGAFKYAYDGSSGRIVSQNFANGLTGAMTYGSNLQDFALQQISYAVAATPISQFAYGYDIPRAQITTWSQQAGSESPSMFSFAYDAVNQLLSGVVTDSGVTANTFGYSYDPAGNRLSEQAGGATKTATYNTLNQLSTIANGAVNARTNEWDAQQRLTAVNAGNLRTEFAYDGMSRLATIRQLQNGSQISFRRFVWRDGRICEERDASGGKVTKRFYTQGVKLETGPSAGAYYYSRDHLGSIRELTDASGNVRARYSYDPFGRSTKVSGDVDADFGFAGMFWTSEASLALTRFRAYDPELGRWLSRDPLGSAETKQGPNLYDYVGNEPVKKRDPEGLNPTAAGSVAVALYALEVEDPEAFEVFAEDLGLVAHRAGQLAQQGAGAVVQECEDAATVVMETVIPVAENVAPSLSQTLPGIGPDTINVLAQTAPQLEAFAPSLPEYEPSLGEIPEEPAWAAAQWFTRTMSALLPYRQSLGLTDYESQMDFVNGLESFSKLLFGL